MTAAREREGRRAPSLSEFSAYLARAGWTFQDQDDRTALWLRPASLAGSQRAIRVVLPIEGDVSDYDESAYRAMRAIAFAEHRAFSDVEADIRYGPADVMAVRLRPPTPSGQAPLTLARDALDWLRELVVGSASGLSHPGYLVPPKFKPRAEAFADLIRVSTGPGSFIVTMSVPLATDGPVDGEHVQPESDAELDDDLEIHVEPPADFDAESPREVPVSPPFGRLVVARMRRVVEHSVELAQHVVAGTARIDAFGEVPAATGNALELQALAAIGGLNRTPYIVRFSYSPTVTEELREPRPTRVATEVASVLASAADRLRTPMTITNITVIGRVVGLVRGRKSRTGVVTIDGRYGDTKPRQYRARLAPAEYDLALRAHHRGLDVSITGDVTPGHIYTIQPISAVQVSQGLEDNDDL